MTEEEIKAVIRLMEQDGYLSEQRTDDLKTVARYLGGGNEAGGRAHEVFEAIRVTQLAQPGAAAAVGRPL